MKISLIQLCAGSNKSSNIKNACSLILSAIEEGAKFVLLPEVFNYRGEINSKVFYKHIPEFIPGDSILPLMDLAKKNNIHILAGSIYEKIPESKKFYNSSILIDNNGQLVKKYRKRNLFKANIDGKTIDEGDFFLAGNKNLTHHINKIKFGLSICYDLRFPELFREYFDEKVDVLLIPSSFTTKTGKLHWKILLRARAIENYCYVLAPNQYGIDGNGVETYGHSMAIDPQGKILSVLDKQEEGIITINISKNKQSRFPVIS